MTVSEDAVVEGARAISGVDFSVFPDPSFRISRAVLEAAGPRMAHDYWLEGRNADSNKFVANPYPVSASHETVDRLSLMEKAITGVLEIHREMPNWDEYGEPAVGTHCEECTDIDEGELVHEIYPCKTVREIRTALAGQPSWTDMRNKIERMAK